MYLEAVCPVCNSEIVHEIDVYERETLNGVRRAYAYAKQSWEKREFVDYIKQQIWEMLPMSIQEIKDFLREQNLGNLVYEIIDEIKLAGAYEKEGVLYVA